MLKVDCSNIVELEYTTYISNLSGSNFHQIRLGYDVNLVTKK